MECLITKAAEECQCEQCKRFREFRDFNLKWIISHELERIYSECLLNYDKKEEDTKREEVSEVS